MTQDWTSSTLKPRHTATTAHAEHVITCMQFDDHKVVTGSDDTLINVHDIKSGDLRTELRDHESGIWCLQYEGNVLVSGSVDRTVRVWDIVSGRCKHVLRGHTDTVRCLQIVMPAKTTTMTASRNSKDAIGVQGPPLIISGSRDGEIRVWLLPGTTDSDQESPQSGDYDNNPYFLRSLSGHSQAIRHIAASGDTLISGSDDATVRVWRISTGETRHVLAGHSQRVSAVILNDGRSQVISASLDSSVKVWNPEGDCLFTLKGHESPVRCLALHGEHLSSADDTTIYIWNVVTGDRLKNLAIDAVYVSGLVHLDATRIIWGGSTAVKMQNTRTEECVSLLSDLNATWQVKSDGRKCVAAVQRGEVTYIEILDFGAAQDVVPAD